jgi:hypothetical protein
MSPRQRLRRRSPIALNPNASKPTVEGSGTMD